MALQPLAEAGTATSRFVVVIPMVNRHQRTATKILEEQRIHRALAADVQVRDVAFGERDDIHAGEREAFEQTSGVFLVATETIERLRKNDVEVAFSAARISA